MNAKLEQLSGLGLALVILASCSPPPEKSLTPTYSNPRVLSTFRIDSPSTSVFSKSDEITLKLLVTNRSPDPITLLCGSDQFPHFSVAIARKEGQSTWKFLRGLGVHVTTGTPPFPFHPPGDLMHGSGVVPILHESILQPEESRATVLEVAKLVQDDIGSGEYRIAFKLTSPLSPLGESSTQDFASFSFTVE